MKITPTEGTIMHNQNNAPSDFLLQSLSLLREAAQLGPVLDLACGKGRNGLHLAAEGLPVVFLDRSREALETLRQSAADQGLDVEVKEKDMEAPGGEPLPVEAFGGIIVFNYLHRPLFPDLRAAVKPGGIVVYETFTIEQAALGKPSNPDYLLKPGELPELFPGWEVLHYDEGERSDPRRYTARLAAQKPLE